MREAFDNSESKVTPLEVFFFPGGSILYFYIFVPSIFGDCFVKYLLMKRQRAFLVSRSFSQKKEKKEKKLCNSAGVHQNPTHTTWNV